MGPDLKRLKSSLNSYSILFVFSPFFVIFVFMSAIPFATFVMILLLILLLTTRRSLYLFVIPFLVLFMFYGTIYLVIPVLAILYYSLFPYTGWFAAVALIGVALIAVFYFLLSAPELRLGKLSLQPAMLCPLYLASLMLIFVLLPIAFLIGREEPSSFFGAISDPRVTSAIWLSLEAAFYATVLALIFGLPFAYILARRDFLGKALVQGIIDVPIVIPHTVSGIALLLVFGSAGLIGAPLEEVGIRFSKALPGIVVAMIFVSAPFVINSAHDGFKGVDPRLENVARSLGGSRFRTFATVTFPLAFRNILSGSIMCWARAVSEFGAVIFLAYYPMIAPTLIWDKFTQFGLKESMPIAVLLVLICLAVFVLLRAILAFRFPFSFGRERND